MDSRERLLNCLNGRPVDRVPISTYEFPSLDFNTMII